MNRLTRCLLLSLALLTAGGCGFSLRGSDALSARLPELQLVLQQPASEFATVLRRALRDAGVATRESDGTSLSESLPVLAVGAEQLRIRPITVTPRARAAQYDVRLAVPFSVALGQRSLIEAEELFLQQVYYENTGNIIGTLEERRVIEQELRRDLVNQLLRRLQAVAASDL